MKIVHVVGARPNFMKLAPVYEAFERHVSACQQYILHTGQHYDKFMSDIFFQELNIPAPDFNLEIGSGTHTEQTARAMLGIEKKLQEIQPDWVMVYGDINAALSTTLVCAKMHLKIAHVEAGFRSFDRSMPEEVNRLVTDQLADLLFTPSIDGNQHLKNEGISKEKIHFVGNVMIDTLIKSLQRIQEKPELVHKSADFIKERLKSQAYILATIHRPFNVDDIHQFKNLLNALIDVSKKQHIVFPIHPRTKKQLNKLDLSTIQNTNLHLIEPQGYFDFLFLQKNAALVLTDSGGVQEETTYLGVPCITLRPNTERPVTIHTGTNILHPQQDYTLLATQINTILENKDKKGKIPDLWDGKASERIAKTILTLQ